MENTTMTMHAVVCVDSVRPRRANALLAATAFGDQGTTVSIVALAPMGLRLIASDVVAVESPITGDSSVAGVTAFQPTYKTSDVVRSRSGRPPV